jgi:hypothetical protein
MTLSKCISVAAKLHEAQNPNVLVRVWLNNNTPGTTTHPMDTIIAMGSTQA